MKHLFACRFRQLTGLPCPNCGTTRALLALLRLDVARAVRLSPVAGIGVALLAIRTARSSTVPGAEREHVSPSLEFVLVAMLALGLLRALLVALRVETPFTFEHIDRRSAVEGAR